MAFVRPSLLAADATPGPRRIGEHRIEIASGLSLIGITLTTVINHLA